MLVLSLILIHISLFSFFYSSVFLPPFSPGSSILLVLLLLFFLTSSSPLWSLLPISLESLSNLILPLNMFAYIQLSQINSHMYLEFPYVLHHYYPITDKSGIFCDVASKQEVLTPFLLIWWMVFIDYTKFPTWGFFHQTENENLKWYASNYRVKIHYTTPCDLSRWMWRSSKVTKAN